MDQTVQSDHDNILQIEIPVALNRENTIKRMKLQRLGDRMKETAAELIQKANDIARPKAVYRLSCSSVIDGNTVEIDGVRFTSSLLSDNLRGLDAVFPYIVTSGRELDELEIPDDTMSAVLLNSIKTMVLVSSVDYLASYLNGKYGLKKATHMNPGELDDFPLGQQRPLFALFSDTAKMIGVTLTPSGFMKPLKSRSGIYFSNDTGYISCQYCTQENCPGRKARYKPGPVAGRRV